MSAEEVGKRIKLHRIQKGMRQGDLADAAEISKSYLCELEAGRRSIGGRILLTISQVLDVSMDHLMTGEGQVEPKYKDSPRRVIDDIWELNSRLIRKWREMSADDLRQLRAAARQIDDNAELALKNCEEAEEVTKEMKSQ